MILPIDDKFRLISDCFQWIVQKRRTRKGQEDWKNLAYCTTIEGAVNELAQYRIRTSDAQSLTDALAEIENVVTSLTHALTPRFEVKTR